jgi:prepilin-type N-terminal cleavage/methylation domain-containing protein
MKTVKQSFTLVEILVVIVIIGILSSFIFFTINDSVEKASIAKSKMFSESIRNNLLLNLVSEWKLDGNANDSWGSNNGSPANMSYESEANCISGQCGDFNGSNSYINCGNADSLKNINNEISISAWVNPESAQTNTFPKIVGKSASYLFHVFQEDPTRLAFNIISNSTTRQTATTDAVIVSGKWTHVVVVYDGRYGKIYIDSILLAGPKDFGSVGEIDSSTNSLGIGAYGSGTTLFTGLIDEVQVYNTAISETAIKQNYLSGLNSLHANGLITEKEYNDNN